MRTWLLYVFILLITASLNAQSRWSSGIEVEGGFSGKTYLLEEDYVSFSNGYFYDRTEARRYPGMGGGVWAEYWLTNRIGLYTGINYSQWTKYTEFENSRYNAGNQLVTQQQTKLYARQRQLRTPLLMKFYLGQRTDRIRLFFTGGVQLTYLLEHRTITREEYGSITQISNETNVYTETYDLENGWADTERQAIAYVMGAGISRDRVTVSIERSWKERRLTDNYPSSIMGGVQVMAVRPPVVSHYVIRNFYQTSLHFRYRLF